MLLPQTINQIPAADTDYRFSINARARTDCLYGNKSYHTDSYRKEFDENFFQKKNPIV